MVLSNKKLKQKLRATKAERIAASEAQHNLTAKDSENLRDPESKASDSLKILSEAQRAKLSKRQKRRERAEQRSSEISDHREIGGDAEGKTEDGLRLDDMDVKMKKRKRDESEASENVKEKKQEQLNKKKKAKNKRKAKKKAGKKQLKEEVREQNGSEVSAEQLVAKACTSTESRREVELSSKVYVGGIPYYSTEDDIRSYFEGCGTITNVDCMKFPDTGKFRGIAIMTFKTEAAAKRALALDGSDMGGLFLKIQPFKSAKVNKVPNFSPAVLEVTIESTSEICHGIPVRISCAVAKKGTITKLKSMPKDNGVDSGKANPASKDQENASNKVDAVGKDQENGSSKISAVGGDEENSSVVTAVSSKIRRRTCYECGEKGHLSSSCPKKQAADSANAVTT
ncbi:UNVERIFIED_CONTAM: RNA-binding protein 38 [Sesamum latifolium]|uniref:RNA-binding protein 38 n=1 Tax=Sesamum latifolium TaxID=2727402 RepID=A0AAW2X715_9LAMI